MMYDDKIPTLPRDQLVILNGELRGVSVRLDDVSARVGFDNSCDIVLFDENDSGARALINRSNDGQYEITAEVGPVRLGGKHLKTGKVSKARDDAHLQIGGVELVISRSETISEQVVHTYRRRLPGRAWAASLLAASVAIAVVGLMLGEDRVNANAQAQSSGPFVDKQAGFTPVLASEALRTRLDAAGLSRLSTSADRDARLVSVRGSLRPSEADVWLDVRRWFDAKFGEYVEIDARLETDVDSVILPFAVKAVWMSKNPRLTLHDGSHRWAGDDLPGGWRLEELSLDKVKISKNGETLFVSL